MDPSHQFEGKKISKMIASIVKVIGILPCSSSFNHSTDWNHTFQQTRRHKAHNDTDYSHKIMLQTNSKDYQKYSFLGYYNCINILS